MEQLTKISIQLFTEGVARAMQSQNADIPGGRMDPAAVALQALVPLPNRPGTTNN